MVEFTSGMITQMLGYVSLVFADLSNLILLVVGVGLALLVITTIINVFKH
jgi:hypothetical protein